MRPIYSFRILADFFGESALGFLIDVSHTDKRGNLLAPEGPGFSLILCFLLFGHTSPLRSRERQQFNPPFDVECRLSAHSIDDIFDNRCESCPFGSIVEMTQTKVLFNDITFL